MPLVRPPQARNSIKKALYGLLDEPIKRPQLDELWQFFDSQCAYCGVSLDRSRREGHADHLVSVCLGGTNSMPNFVLSCGRCNGDYKREMDWEPFLSQRNPDPQMRAERRQRILRWIEQHKGTVPHRDPFLAELVASQVSRALECFNQAVDNVRAARRRSHNPIGRADG
jgi:HNH endonuclease